MLMRMQSEGRRSDGIHSFRLTLPARATWGSLLAFSGQPRCQALTRPCSWQMGNPIPEGLYLVGPLDVAGWDAKGKPDWSASFDPRTPGPIFRDLIPVRRARCGSVTYSIRSFEAAQSLWCSDIYLHSQADLERFYEWSTLATIDLLAVDHGLGTDFDIEMEDDYTRLALLSANGF